MKRTAIAVLVFSLSVFPAFAGKTAAQKSSVNKARCVKFEHINGGWKMLIACEEGRGTIVRRDSQQFVGDGIFARWSQKEMRSLFESLVPDSADKAYLESPQLD